VPGAECFQELGAAAGAAAEIKEGLAGDIAEQLCYGIEADLVGRPLDSQQAIELRVAVRIGIPAIRIGSHDQRPPAIPVLPLCLNINCRRARESRAFAAQRVI
jgi:hypothetical protein